MSTREVPDPEDPEDASQQAFDPQSDIDPLLYSEGLRSTVRWLLSSHRGQCVRPEDLTSSVYFEARKVYLRWKESTPDGKLHRDLLDDGWRRQFNEDERIRADQELLASQGQLSSHRWTMQSLDPQPREPVPPVATPPPS
jgi:hypothetical protein